MRHVETGGCSSSVPSPPARHSGTAETPALYSPPRLDMLQQRRSFSSSTGERGSRQQQQASRPRTSSVWEAVLLVVLLIVTCINLYTYGDRRERFQRAQAGVGAKPATSKSLRLPAPGDDRRYNYNDVGGGGRGGELRTGGGTIVGTTAQNLAEHVYSAAAASAGGGDAQGGGDIGGSVATAGREAGASATKKLPPPPSSSAPPATRPERPTPLGRDRPLQIMAAAPGASNLRWPAAAVGGDGGGGGDGEEGSSWRPGPGASAAEADTVSQFACSLTEVDYAPGLETRSNQEQLLLLKKPWPTSGPCVISCSPPPSPLPPSPLPPSPPESGPSSSLGRFKYCARAVRACELYQECTHVLMPPPASSEGTAGNGDGDGSGGGGGGSGFATLMHRPTEDGSMASVEAAAAAAAATGAARAVGAAGGGWGGSDGGFTLDTKPRTYYVVSFGGSGSKMLGGWLSERGKGMVKKVFHIHDPRPADQLFAKVARKSVTSRGMVGRGKDFRGYDFPEGDFPVDGAAVQDVDSYRVVLIFKDPAEALVSRYFYNHCKNIRGAECGATQADFPSLERYAEESGDRLHMQTFYDNYCDPDTVDKAAARNGGRRRNYPVVCVNYHKMWDNKEALVRALGLPAGEASKLPERTETVRNDQTSAARGEPFTLAMRERLRRKHASLSEKVFGAPAVAIV